MESIRDGQCGKTCLAHCPRMLGTTTGKFSKASAGSAKNRQMFLCLRRENGQAREKSWETITLSHGESSMLRRVGESHKDGGVYLLSSILQDSVPESCSLSQKACQGILRRAEKRGKELPEPLRLALERQAFAPKKAQPPVA